jgi:hypothetical protein
MIFSSTDILRAIGSDPIVRLTAKIKIIDGKLPIEAADGVYIYIAKYPTVTEFEAEWKVWIADTSGEPIDILVLQIQQLLPNASVQSTAYGAEITTTELRSPKTETRPEPKAKAQPQVDVQAQFDALAQDIQDRMLLVASGKNGRNGKDGKDGAPGRDGLPGKDLNATEVNLGDLGDVSVEDAKAGQVLTWDGSDWVARTVPQVFQSGAVSGSGIEEAPVDNKAYNRKNAQWIEAVTSTGGIPEAPMDGKTYARKDGQWVDVTIIIAQMLGIDGGEFSP